MTLSMGSSPAFAQDEPTEEGSPKAAGDANTSEFDALIEQANVAYAERDYARAVDLFEKAYALDPQPNIIYNIARVEERAGRIDVAIDRYDDFLGKGEVDPQFRRDALDRRKLLSEVVEVRDRKAEEAADALTKKDDTAKPLPTTPKTDEEEPSLVGPIVVLGAGLVGLGAAGVLAIQTGARHEVYTDAAATREARETARTEGATLALASDISLGVGVVGTLVGVIWLATSAGESEPSRPSSKIEPVLGEHTGVVWTLTF